ncbi:MAG: CNNM domain-containing protein [Methylophilaceae bacterium]|nr:CNNM domain-containing protein [Methylophilaceae bacterium]
MSNISLFAQIGLLIFLLALSAVFSMAETSLMSLNRYRMRHLANEGHRGAKLANRLLAKPDKLLSVILLCNTLCNVAASTLIAVVTVQLFGNGQLALMIGTLVTTFIILVLAEISPKIIAAAYAEKIGFFISQLLYPLLWLLNPVISFINMLVQAFVRLLGIKLNFKDSQHAVTTEELRSIVNEAGHYIPKHNRTVLLNLLDLEKITVDDVMTTRTQVEMLQFDAHIEQLVHQIMRCQYGRLPVKRGEHEEIIGVLALRKVVHLLHNLPAPKLPTHHQLLELMDKPYFIPAGTPIYSQIQKFQESKEHLALIVDEYGEFKGLITFGDILEEIIGDFMVRSPKTSSLYHLEADGGWVVDGSSSLRVLNRKLLLSLPLQGPKTLNGLLLEYLQDIPEANISLKIGTHTLQILQVQNHVIRRVKIYP